LISSTEWAALIAAGGAVLGAAAGGSVTYFVTSRQIRSTEAEGERQRAHDRDERENDRAHELRLAREEREQQRKHDAYVTLTGHTIWVQKRTEWRLGNLGIRGVIPEPIEPDSNEFIVATASLTLSNQATDMLMEITQRMDRFGDLADSLDATTLTELDKLKLLKLAGDVQEAVRGLLMQLRSELNLIVDQYLDD